jgi:hypothetical protein
VVSVLLTFMLSTVPVMGAPRESDGWWRGDLHFIGKVIKRIKKTLGISSNSDGLTLPTP